MQDGFTSSGNCGNDHTGTADQYGALATKMLALIGNCHGDKATLPKLL
jgi:hypothetical protein